jgi:hypothetical protein
MELATFLCFSKNWLPCLRLRQINQMLPAFLTENPELGDKMGVNLQRSYLQIVEIA